MLFRMWQDAILPHDKQKGAAGPLQFSSWRPRRDSNYYPSMGHGDLKQNRLSYERRLMAPSARLEHATYCSASKRSNPLSYEGIGKAVFYRG